MKSEALMEKQNTSKQQSTYKKQTFLSFFQFSTEVLNLIIVIVTAFTTRSLIIFMDVINSVGNTLRTGLMAAFSKKMTKNRKYEYNYGIGKAEAMIAFFCNCFVFIGLVATLVFSIIEIIHPKEQQDALLWGIIFKVFCVLFDIPMVVGQYKIKKENSNKVTSSGFMAVMSAFIFDVAALVSIGIIYVTKDLSFAFADYISPILSILIAIFLLVICFKQLIDSISELTDKTLPEKEQLKILKVISKNYDKFEGFDNVKTRYNGTVTCVDVSITFSDETNFKDIRALREDLQQQLNEVIDDCVVTIIVE